jgi:tetratricopeptide (TPR) repeat protein
MSTSTTVAGNNAPVTVTAQGVSGGKVEVVSGGSNFVMPDLNRPIEVLAPLPVDVAKQTTALLIEKTNALKANPNDVQTWIVLGSLRRGIGDETGARDIWTYVTLRWPDLAVPWHNLGELYRYDYKDLAKAETNYLEAIKRDKKLIDSYVALDEMYRSEDMTQKSVAILTKGVDANPTSNTLLLRLARLLVDQGDKTAAKTHYQKAYDLAVKAGDTTGAAQIKEEMDAL